MKAKITIPESMDAWLDEIVLAYRDAAEVIPFGPMVNHDISDSDLFHLGPAECLKFRGLNHSATNIQRATEAALSSYVSALDLNANLLDKPHFAFAFCYIVSHFGLGLIDEATTSDILDHIADQVDTLARRIGQEYEQ